MQILTGYQKVEVYSNENKTILQLSLSLPCTP